MVVLSRHMAEEYWSMKTPLCLPLCGLRDIGWFLAWGNCEWSVYKLQIQVSVWIQAFVSFRKITRTGIADSYVKCLCNFIKNWLFAKVAISFHLLSSHLWIPVSPYPHQHLILSVSLYFSHPNKYVVASHCALICISLETTNVEHLLMCFFAICTSLEKGLLKYFVHFQNIHYMYFC